MTSTPIPSPCINTDSGSCRFFAHYHPSCPIFLRRREPAPLYRAEPLLFWAICGIGARRQAPPGVAYADLMDVVKDMVAGLLSEPWRTLGAVQALVLLCEWQVPATARWGGRGWYYGGLVRLLSAYTRSR